MPVIRAVNVDSLLAYLQNDLVAVQELTPESPLFSSGLLDSVAMVSLIAFVEDATGADVRPSDVTLDNFDTISRIVEYAATLA
ncbi:MAG: phosphopantetheine-containing protein [Alphaproteobacteria bacterium]|nr:MAG: phosphopantetheine-containing protein [Alphaproteobacteria bacterium]